MNVSTGTSPAAQLEHHLADARVDLLGLAVLLTGGTSALEYDLIDHDLLAGALDAIASLAAGMAAEVRGEQALR